MTMSIRDALSIALVATTLALAGVAGAGDPAKPPSEPGSNAQSCAHHQKAMHAMGSDKEREAYCHAHSDCMKHDCGGMAEKARAHGHGDVDPPPAPAQPKKP
jgi:hypothetical protein